MKVYTSTETIRTAPADQKPCEIRSNHGFPILVTQGHHRRPVFLQNRIYGKIVDTELMWLCGSDHDNVHAWLYHLLAERSKPTVDPGRFIRAEAQATYAWYVKALSEKQAQASGTVPGTD